MEIEKAVSSVSLLIDQDTLGCHSNQNSRDLRQYKFIPCSNRVHGWYRVLSRAPGPHVLAGYSWLLQCNSTSISTCISTTAKVKGRERAQTHPTRKYIPPRQPLTSCFIGNSRPHGHTIGTVPSQGTVPPTWPEGKGKNQMPVHRSNIYHA